ncbi:MAG TPA: hypothetical protein VHI77_09285 [Solirubrobacterales bacterium]|jgi:hypothetical protein|nr:hypothetical protein [Solirubrobacterales bacterium]
MRKYLVLTLALGALIAVSVAGIATAGNQPVTVRAGNLELTFNGGFSPKALSKKTLTPIALSAEGKIKTVDGTHPPALKEFLLETDKNGAVNVKGYPTCKSGQLQAQDTAHAEKICKPAIIGTGTTNVEIEFPESKPIPVSSKLLVFNGGEKGGVTTFFIHAYITVPTPAAIVTTVKIKKIHHGRFGLLAVASVPKIAGGSGSVTSFGLKVDKKFTFKGKKVSVLSAKCPDGKLQAHGTAVFSDGTKASAEIIRTCVGKG